MEMLDAFIYLLSFLNLFSSLGPGLICVWLAFGVFLFIPNDKKKNSLPHV
jgi:hypothetical protein